MKRLVRLLLVNWYRLEQASIEIEGHTAFIGPNASGKSSLLDAIQTVLVGGNKNELALNASAGEKSTRSIREYCLGVVRDPDSAEVSLELRPRDHAVTYLVLCFRDEDTSDEIAVGLAMHASLDQPQEQIDGRFIASGESLLLSDLVEHTPNGVAPKPWMRVREELYRRYPAVKIVPQPGEFVRQLCGLLCDRRRQIDSQRFLKSFRNAITFAPVRNVSDFVRQFVLEARPIQVRQLQMALKHYRDICTKTEEAKVREAALGQIQQLFTGAEKAERRALSYRWTEQKAAHNSVEAEIEPLQAQLEEHEQQRKQNDGSLQDLKEELGRATQKWIDGKAKLEASAAAQSKARIAAERGQFREKRAGIQTQLDQSRRGLAKVHRLVDESARLPLSLHNLLAELATRLDERDELLATLWPEHPAAITDVVSRLLPLVQESREHMKASLEAQAVDMRRLQAVLEEARTRIKRMETGESDLSAAARRLIALLAAHGISAVPLCDRLDVSDERWRDAVERFLGGQRESLLVPPEQVREAIRVYRYEGKREGIFGSRIVNTLKNVEWKDRIELGSLAEVVSTEDGDARAYVNRLMTNVKRVETEDELLKYERAVTPDGMLATNGAITRTQPVEAMLGRDARARSLEVLRQRFQEQAQQFSDLQADKTAMDKLKEELLDPFGRHIETTPDLVKLVQERAVCESRLAELETEEHSLDTADYEQLKTNVDLIERQRNGFGTEIDNLQTRMSKFATSEVRLTVALEGKKTLLLEFTERQSTIEQCGALDREDAQRRLEEIEGQQLAVGDEVGRWRTVEQQSAERASRGESECRRSRTEAREKFRDYIARWPAEEMSWLARDADHRPLADWTLRVLTEIHETQLGQYHEQAKNALREAEHAFRADFMSRLKENLSRLDEQLNELRRNLKSRPFHGQYYSFIKKPDPDFEPILRWIENWTPDQAGNVGGLFDTTRDPSHPHHDAIHRIQTLLMEASVNNTLDERLADYRYYYTFDVKMTDADGRNPELLSRRLGKGSGGEHQAPFYVAIGAALAAAYRLQSDDDGRTSGGMALAVFDEAFSKLDVQNTVSALGFLDKLGLQVILAAPDEKYGLMSEHMDTIVNVYRSGGTVFVDADYVKPAARALLSADNPTKRSVELDSARES